MSYAHEDEKRARLIGEILEQAGFRVWSDVKLSGGQRFTPAIEAALEGAKAVIVLWSKASVTSPWVLDLAQGEAGCDPG